jgi:hypothetical protein
MGTRWRRQLAQRNIPFRLERRLVLLTPKVRFISSTNNHLYPGHVPTVLPTSTAAPLQVRVIQIPAVSVSSTRGTTGSNGIQGTSLPRDATIYIYTTATLDSNPTKIHDDDRHTSSLVWRGRRLQHPYSTENISDIRNNNNHQTQTTTPPIGTTIRGRFRVSDLRLWWWDYLLVHFLPAQYPHSVSPGYAQYSLASFCAGVAGSAAMVLSTQTLLVSVGAMSPVWSSGATAAGALNWIWKDGIGQAGGVVFASQMGTGKHFDANPKKWRLVAALCLDLAALMELLTPLLLVAITTTTTTSGTTALLLPATAAANSSTPTTTTATSVLVVACVAGILKNIGFITASASRVALHQNLAVTENIGDVTAKCATQSMAAGLLGTSLGIALSSIVGGLCGGDDTSRFHSFVAAFGGLALVHQGCNYAAVQAVRLRHLNRHRLYILLKAFVDSDGNKQRLVLSPDEVAKREVTFPLRFGPEDDSHRWLVIGSDLPTMCPGGPEELKALVQHVGDAMYLLNIHGTATKYQIHLTFFERAQGEDLIQGMLAAIVLRRMAQNSTQEESLDRKGLCRAACEDARKHFPDLFAAMKEHKWKTGTDHTSVEPNGAVRFDIRQI